MLLQVAKRLCTNLRTMYLVSSEPASERSFGLATAISVRCVTPGSFNRACKSLGVAKGGFWLLACVRLRVWWSTKYRLVRTYGARSLVMLGLWYAGSAGFGRVLGVYGVSGVSKRLVFGLNTGNDCWNTGDEILCTAVGALCICYIVSATSITSWAEWTGYEDGMSYDWTQIFMRDRESTHISINRDLRHSICNDAIHLV